MLHFSITTETISSARLSSRAAVVGRDMRVRLGSSHGDRAERFRHPLPATVFGGMGEGDLSIYSIIGSSLASRQREIDLNLRLHFNGFAIQQIRLVLPLLYGIHGGLCKHRVPVDEVQVLNGTVFADHGL